MVDWFERFSIKSADLLLLLSKEIWEELELWYSFVLVNCSALFTAILKHSNREDLKNSPSQGSFLRRFPAKTANAVPA